MKFTCLIVFAVLLYSCGKDPSEDVITYTRQLKPDMTVEDVKKLFPKKMHLRDESADEDKENCWMERRYSTNMPVRRLVFLEPDSGYRATTVYFDSDDKLIGINFSASSGLQLLDTDLRFPGELIQCCWKTLHWHKTEEGYLKCQKEYHEWMEKQKNKNE